MPLSGGKGALFAIGNTGPCGEPRVERDRVIVDSSQLTDFDADRARGGLTSCIGDGVGGMGLS